MKLSVIVPVYNVEKFLPRCLNSLLRQGMELGEWEIICVNDGSPDNCATILAEYETKHPDLFKIITQKNQGLGAARNMGLSVAQGEWVGFVDSDDYLIDGAYKYILQHFCDDDVEVVNFNCTLAYTDGESLYDAEAIPDGVISFDGDGTDAYNKQCFPCVWSKLYRRSFLEEHKIRFVAAFQEDELFNFDVFSHSPFLRIVTSNIYRYEQGNPHSLLMTVDKEIVKNQLMCVWNVAQKMNDYLQQDDAKMKTAAMRLLHVSLKTYYNKMLKACLTQREWKACVIQLKALPIYKVDISAESSFLGKTIAALKNESGNSFVVYRVVEFLFRVVFMNVVRPRIIASYSK